MKLKRFVRSLPAIIALPVSLQASGNDAFRNYLEQAFATSIVLTDSDVFTVGVHDFDPNDWFNLQNEEIGSEESVRLDECPSIICLRITIRVQVCNIGRTDDSGDAWCPRNLRNRVSERTWISECVPSLD